MEDKVQAESATHRDTDSGGWRRWSLVTVVMVLDSGDVFMDQVKGEGNSRDPLELAPPPTAISPTPKTILSSSSQAVLSSGSQPVLSSSSKPVLSSSSKPVLSSCSQPVLSTSSQPVLSSSSKPVLSSSSQPVLSSSSKPILSSSSKPILSSASKPSLSSSSKPSLSSSPQTAVSSPSTLPKRTNASKQHKVVHNGLPAAAERRLSLKGGVTHRAPLRRPLSLEVPSQRLRCSQDATAAERRVVQPPWRSGTSAPWPPTRSLTSPSLGVAGWMRRSESTCSVNVSLRASTGQMRPATSLPHIAKGAASASRPCLLVALRPLNLEQEKTAFFQADYRYEPQFEYAEPEPRSVLEKYREGSGLFLEQAVGIMECVLKKFGSYENFEEVTGGNVLPKSQVWASVRKYLQKEGCVGEVVVRLSDELLSQAVMVVESCRPTLTINLSGARQHWLEGMLRHEIGTHYLRGVNNSLQPWATAEGRKQFGLKPVNPTEEGLASLHSVLLRKQPYLWRAALLYYTVYHAASMTFSQLFNHIGRFVRNPDVRWEYCLRAKRGQTDTSKPGCFSKDQVYLDGILRILRHRRSIDFQMLTSLGKVSYEDVPKLRPLAVLTRTRIPHFLKDPDRYLQHLDHIVSVNELDDATLQELLP